MTKAPLSQLDHAIERSFFNLLNTADTAIHIYVINE